VLFPQLVLVPAHWFYWSPGPARHGVRLALRARAIDRTLRSGGVDRRSRL